MKKLLALLLPAALAAACTSVETAPGNSSGTSTGSGGSGGASSSGSSGSSGTGGALSSSSSSGTGGTGGGFVLSSSSSSSSGTGGSSCAGVDTFMDVTGDGAPQHFTSLCVATPVLGNPTGPVAFTPTGGGILPTLMIAGCATSQSNSPEMSLTESAASAPGTDTMATALYIDGSQSFWQSMAAGDVSVALTHYEDVGGVVEGSYSAKVTFQGASKTLSGSFRACHVWDLPKP